MQESELPSSRPGARLIAVTAGLAVAVVMLEALLAGIAVLAPELDLDARIHAGQNLPGTARLILIGAWVIASGLGGLMATAISSSRTVGCIAGVLLMAPALVIGVFSGMPEAFVSALGVSPLVGAALGAWLAGVLHR